MKKYLTLSISLIIFLSGIFSANALDPLDADDMQHFMNAMQPLQDLGKKHDFEGDEEENLPAEESPDVFSPMTDSLSLIKQHEAYGEFVVIIQNAGFHDAAEWANVGDRVMRAYMSLKMAQELTPEKRQEMEKSIREIEQNDYLSPDMKKQLITGLKQSLNIFDQKTDENTDDQNAVQPYLSRLESLFKELK